MSFNLINYLKPDLDARSVERTLLEFRESPVFQSLLAALMTEVDALNAAIEQVVNLRTPALATGENEEVIGRIVGMERITFDYGYLNWFTPDNTSYPPDLTMAWVDGAPLGVLQQVGDESYRSLIEAKIFRNFTQYGSIPELQVAIETAYGVKSGFLFTTTPMDVNIILPKATPNHIKSFVTGNYSNRTAEDIYFPPYAMTWRINGIVDLEDYVLTDDNTGAMLTDDNGLYLTP